MSATGIALRCSGTFCPGSSRKPTTRIDPQSAICSKPKGRCSSRGRSDTDQSCVTIFPMEIIHSTGVEGAQQARGLAVVIDVLRSFTVSAYALAGGARECRLVTTTDEARVLSAATPGAVLSAEEEGLPLPGIAISNSPTQIPDTNLKDRILIQRSSAGTPVAAAVRAGVDIFAASLVVARATVQACLLRHPDVLTLIASADYPEDHACALYMEAIIKSEGPDVERLLQ